MSARYVSETFSADAGRSGASVRSECRAHQRARALLKASERTVRIDGIALIEHRARVTVRGADGYPIGLVLVAHGGHRQLDGSGPAQLARAHGQQVSPSGSLYAYRIPAGFVSGATRLGSANANGVAFSTAVGLPGDRSGDGIAVWQTVYGSGIHAQPALRAAIPSLDRFVRATRVARVIGPPEPGKIGGRLAVTWNLIGTRTTPGSHGKFVFVFSSAANVVVVNCHWPQAGAAQAALRSGCNSVLSTLAVG